MTTPKIGMTANAAAHSCRSELAIPLSQVSLSDQIGGLASPPRGAFTYLHCKASYLRYGTPASMCLASGTSPKGDRCKASL